MDITTELPEILQEVDRPGNFSTGGHFRFYPPTLVVEGVGPLALPLLPMQAKALIATAQLAPYGRGEKTLVDREVRRTWQVDAERLTIEGEGWWESLEKLVGDVKRTLGVRGKVEAELYKLLIYDEGSFFVEHRDTEKRAGMFATLVIVLPCDYEGGELMVRHQGQEKCFDLHTNAADSAGYADGDEAVAGVLVTAAAESDCEIYLALLSQEESGGAEYDSYDYGGRRGRHWDEPDDADFEIGEVYDIDCHTETKGRPYTLVCRKNQNSYNRRVEQRKRDEQDLAELEQVTGQLAQ